MSEAEETPAQRQARIRQQKREAKISASAAERLDKITRLSGRAPESMRNDSSPVPTSPAPGTPNATSTMSPLQGFGASPDTLDPAQLRAQEEFFRNMLRAPPPGGGPPGQGAEMGTEQEDPMMKMLNSLLAGTQGGDPNDPSSPPGLNLSPDDISKATGLPSFLTNMVMGGKKAAPTAAEVRETRMWKIIHVIFAVVAGLYLMFIVDQSIEKFGENPPAPATLRNPFIVFTTGEVLIQGARVALAGQAGKRGFGLVLQMLKDAAGDGAVMVFMLGLATWWEGLVT